ncbi:hypothetical protein DVV81_08320 [Clostridium botulinum]|uniref:hypothetical protein n=1 Tax=Clostridium botulinum TaxID=1491 RepID=UPI001967E8AA|nr:hypothetical protein [Clostridium botulinum]MBN1071174.1 hypothetical protein [Clostridium botulinum]
MKLLSLFLVITSISAAIKCLSYFYGLCGLIHYMEINNMKIPDDKELKEATEWAVKNSVSNLVGKISNMI